jgi:hypothetical protein
LKNMKNSVIEYDREAVLAKILPRLNKCEPLAEILRIGDVDAEVDFPKSCITIFNWMRESPSFAEAIAQAREAGGDYLAAQCLTIADSTPKDMVDVTHQRLRIETRLRLLAKWHPKRYGDKIDITSNGETITISPLAQLREMVKERQDFSQSPVVDVSGVTIEPWQQKTLDKAIERHGGGSVGMVDNTPAVDSPDSDDGSGGDVEDVSIDDCI